MGVRGRDWEGSEFGEVPRRDQTAAVVASATAQHRNGTGSEPADRQLREVESAVLNREAGSAAEYAFSVHFVVKPTTNLPGRPAGCSVKDPASRDTPPRKGLGHDDPGRERRDRP